MGIYSRPVKLGDKLNDGDRVEIYRPLIADPKELRRQRAEQAKSKAQSAPYFLLSLWAAIERETRTILWLS